MAEQPTTAIASAQASDVAYAASSKDWELASLIADAEPVKWSKWETAALFQVINIHASPPPPPPPPPPLYLSLSLFLSHSGPPFMTTIAMTRFPDAELASSTRQRISVAKWT
eukprot:1161218-Pelagomonas_calceolata.AAC.3